jgi:2-succinyl-5-enolpyruvyl-6-hydroxy-3-cyclohexene-1-carboxylate synthase
MSQVQLIQNALRLLAELGVREICVAAGARNAPMLAALLRSQNIQLWNFFDERSAGFFALGRILATGRPVAILTTSGTAAAELLPAIIEAHYQALPLIAFTADRPKSYRGTGAPQSIEQAHLFTPYASTHWDLDRSTLIPSAAEAILSSPLHINLCLDEPLETDVPGIDFNIKPFKPVADPANATPDLDSFVNSRRPVILAAGLTSQEANLVTPLLQTLNIPVVAEATSNLWSTSSLSHLLYPPTEETLRLLSPDHVLRLGAVPTSRWWRDLENRTGTPVVNFSRAPFPGLARRENVSLFPLTSFVGKAVTSRAKELPPRPVAPATSSHPFSEPHLLKCLQELFNPFSRVFLGNSLPIREVNDTIASLPQGIRFFANRGANGIDGLTSTWLGISADPTSHDSWLILGDLSALYDLSAPWVLPQLPSARRFIVVVNNGGGKIFSRVASLKSLPLQARAFIENQHTLSFKPFADLWNLSHTLIRDSSEFPPLLSYPEGTHLVEILPDPAQTEAYWAASS